MEAIAYSLTYFCDFAQSSALYYRRHVLPVRFLIRALPHRVGSILLAAHRREAQAGLLYWALRSHAILLHEFITMYNFLSSFTSSMHSSLLPCSVIAENGATNLPSNVSHKSSALSLTWKRESASAAILSRLLAFLLSMNFCTKRLIWSVILIFLSS